MSLCKVTESRPFPIHNHANRFNNNNHHIRHKMNSINNEDILSPLPNCNACGSPRLRQRSQTMDSSLTRPRVSLPKDPIQPKHGSISDIHMQVSDQNGDDEEEEDELFVELPAMRTRSNTCPESVINRRKLKVRSQRRPSTPPPEDLCTAFTNMTIPHDIDRQIEIMVKFNET